MLDVYAALGEISQSHIIKLKEIVTNKGLTDITPLLEKYRQNRGHNFDQFYSDEMGINDHGRAGVVIPGSRFKGQGWQGESVPSRVEQMASLSRIRSIGKDRPISDDILQVLRNLSILMSDDRNEDLFKVIDVPDDGMCGLTSVERASDPNWKRSQRGDRAVWLLEMKNAGKLPNADLVTPSEIESFLVNGLEPNEINLVRSLTIDDIRGAYPKYNIIEMALNGSDIIVNATLDQTKDSIILFQHNRHYQLVSYNDNKIIQYGEMKSILDTIVELMRLNDREAFKFSHQGHVETTLLLPVVFFQTAVLNMRAPEAEAAEAEAEAEVEAEAAAEAEAEPEAAEAAEAEVEAEAEPEAEPEAEA